MLADSVLHHTRLLCCYVQYQFDEGPPTFHNLYEILNVLQPK